MSKYAIPGVKTFEFTKIIGLENIEFGNNIIIDDFVFLHAKAHTKIGNYVHLASFSSITGGGECELNDFIALSSGARILTGTDDFKNFGFGNSTVPEGYRNVHRGKVTVGRFVLIGANSVILPDVTIGEGTTVGAGSVITKDLEPWSIYIGNRKIGSRNRHGVLENYQKFLTDHEK